ncbi:hypothetical protein RAE21_12265 [Rhodoferax sp. TBRC 17198]|uniref:hypothetical protein n=1 Tax=Rhodoferax potami TaxID=3068338 RepID=UPI0028BE2729|nr:hypothetical protein [Rhodoferax sp. TBRC 17198]MDT7523171.1 hypothetical protein [Rhodoferax sp. TBRC 17198]
MSTTEAEFIQLRAENEALKALLAKHDIAVPQPSKFNTGDAALQPTANGLSQTAKVQLFRRLFRGRDDIYPVRWINKALSPYRVGEYTLALCAAEISSGWWSP